MNNFSTVEKIKIIIIEDHTILRETLAGTLEKEDDFTVVGHWDDAESALLFLEKQVFPDIAIIDNMLPGMNGIAFARILRTLAPDCQTIILSMDAREEDMFEAFEAGVMGYLPKVVSVKELADSIRSVMQGERIINQKLADKFIKYCTRLKTKKPINITLTEEQKKILEMAREGLSNKEISEDLNLNLSTIKLRFREICKKLDARDRTQAVIEAIKLGLLALEN